MPVTENRNFLAHVNSLRGLAILLVFLFHLAPAFCPGGYYGVDVFFVISGYFLAASTLARMEQGRFSWRHYYVGKLSRLVPSVLVLVALVTAAGLIVMPAVDLEKIADLALSLLGAQSNRYFAEHALDYFGTDVRDNPLLHTWYISVWIQILIAAPLASLLLSRLPRRIGRALLLLAGLASLVVFFQRLLPSELAAHLPTFVKDGGSAGSVYYMTFGRLWEVIAGALLYLLTAARRPAPHSSTPGPELLRTEALSSAPSCPAPAPGEPSVSSPDRMAENCPEQPNSPTQPAGEEALSPSRTTQPERRFLSRAFTVAGLLLVLAAAFMPTESLGAGAAALAVLGALLIVHFGGKAGLPGGGAVPLLAQLGTISFSLYLVHWPLMALWRYVAVRDFLPWEYPLVILLSLLLSSALYRGIEKRRFPLLFIVALWVLLGAALLGLKQTHGLIGRLHPEADALPRVSDDSYGAWRFASPESCAPLPACLNPLSWHYGGCVLDPQSPHYGRSALLAIGDTSRPPDFVLLGDSYANALYPGMDIVGRRRGWSGLFLNTYVTPFWGRSNRENPNPEALFTEQKALALLDWLRASPSIRCVIIYQHWYWRKRTTNTDWSGAPIAPEDSLRFYEESLREFCRRVRATGKELVLVMPTPEAAVREQTRLGEAIRRRRLFTDDPWATFDWSSDMKLYRRYHAEICAMLRRMEAEGCCRLLDPVPILMPDGIFRPVEGQRLLLFDHCHLSVDGAVKLTEGLAEAIDTILAEARGQAPADGATPSAETQPGPAAEPRPAERAKLQPEPAGEGPGGNVAEGSGGERA